ncbi:hypothetical protein HAX54_044634 [Datura stramonium]|uniref:Uncharacterized protein n=1 Tax=Datura stramonium TaxID=4076 RepID=A0ABS8SPE4_DATST|nr:hypothetical protein [Datura stramonium]
MPRASRMWGHRHKGQVSYNVGNRRNRDSHCRHRQGRLGEQHIPGEKTEEFGSRQIGRCRTRGLTPDISPGTRPVRSEHPKVKMGLKMSSVKFRSQKHLWSSKMDVVGKKVGTRGYEDRGLESYWRSGKKAKRQLRRNVVTFSKLHNT